jgi:hypothetical protein
MSSISTTPMNLVSPLLANLYLNRFLKPNLDIALQKGIQ